MNAYFLMSKNAMFIVGCIVNGINTTPAITKHSKGALSRYTIANMIYKLRKVGVVSTVQREHFVSEHLAGHIRVLYASANAIDGLLKDVAKPVV